MTKRVMPKHNVFNNPDIHFFLEPVHIADHYWAKVTGCTNVLLDYYVQATDGKGNTHKSEIQHVWVDSAAGSDTGGGGSTNACNGRVCVEPAPAVQGSPVNVYYSPAAGPLSSAVQVYLHLGWNNWSAVVSPDAPMAFNAESNRWEIAVQVPANATRLDCVFNNGSGNWDNNGGADWHFAVTTNSMLQPPTMPTGLTAIAVSSNQINLSWSAAFGATGYVITRDATPVASTMATSYSETDRMPNTRYCYTVTATNTVGTSAPSAPACATTPAGVITNFPPFTMDGTADFAGYRFSTNGPGLYAALRGTRLYVACQSAANGTTNDHFLFVTDQLLGSASAGAPWAKAGQVAVASSNPFISAEGNNNYVVWNHAPVGSPVTKASSSAGVMEGTLDLAAAFGSVPSVIHLAAAAYATADGGTLNGLAPRGAAPNIDPGEFLTIPTEALRDHNADGLFDRLDPALGFQLARAEVRDDRLVHTWNVMPERSYQLEAAPWVGGPWTNVPGGPVTAGPLQLSLAFSNVVSPSQPCLFHRLALLPAP
jgi:hypothetical protein